MLHQMDELHWSLEKFFYYLVTDKFMKIPKMMDLVHREYIKMIQRLSADEKRNLFCIEAVLNEAHQQNWKGAKRHLARAEQQYQDIILPYWKEEKEQYDRLQDLHLRAKAQIHRQQFQPKRTKSTNNNEVSTSKVKSNSADGSKKVSLKERIFSKSQGENGDVSGKTLLTQQTNRLQSPAKNGIVNGMLPSIVSTRTSKKGVSDNGVLLSTRKSIHQQVAIHVNSKSSEIDTISTRQSLLSGPLDIPHQGQGNGVAFINESQKMHEAAPDVPDVTDTIAEKIADAFQEVYDSEWQEAFKEIKKLQAGKQSPMKERDIIKCLREIVLRTYAFCREEASKQAKMLEQACVCIMTTGEIKGVQDLKTTETEFAEFLYEYRKHMADLSVSRVQNIFVFNHLDKILDKFSLKRSSKSAISDYSKKCVEISWWMCVQRPPIFMLHGDEDGIFDNNLYRHYRKGGKFKVIEFIVWPALLLNEGGYVLSKGIAQG